MSVPLSTKSPLLCIESLGTKDHGLPFYYRALLQAVSPLLIEEGTSSAVGLFFCTLSRNKKIKIYTRFFNSTTKGGAGMRTPIKGQSTQSTRSITEPTENNVLLCSLELKTCTDMQYCTLAKPVRRVRVASYT